MKRIGLLLLVVTTIVGASPALSQDQGGDRRDRGGGPGGGPGGAPNGGGRQQGSGDRGQSSVDRPDRGQQNMQQQRPGGDDRGRPDRGDQSMRGNAMTPGRDPGFQRPDGQRPPQPGRDLQQNRPGYDRGNGYGGGNYSYNRPPSGNYWRPGNSRPSSNYWQNNRWNNRPVYAPAYRYPRGYSYRQWRPGLILPSLFLGSSYYFDGFGDLGLSAPPYGYRWVRYGPDLVLVDVRSGRIRDVRHGIFG